MKKLIIIFAIVFMVSTSYAWHLKWEYTGEIEADGATIYYKELPAAEYESIDVGYVTEYDLTMMGLLEDTRYEFYIRAYAGNPKSYSGDSDHIRWTNPLPYNIIETDGADITGVISPEVEEDEAYVINEVPEEVGWIDIVEYGISDPIQTDYDIDRDYDKKGRK